MRIRIGSLMILGGLFALGACGGSSDDGGSGGIPLADVPDEIAKAACSAVEKCWGGLLTTILNGEDCVERTRNSLADALPTLEAAEKAGKLKYDGNKASACVDQIAQGGCNIEAAFESPTCRAAIDGTVEVGGECESDVECVGSAYCKAQATCPGTCTEAGAVGVACEYDNQCNDGLRCGEVSKKCFQPGAENGTCGGSSGIGCEDGLFCLGQDDKTGKTGSCKAIDKTFSAGDGATCDLTNGPLCASEFRCVVQSFSTSGIVASCGSSVASGAACKLAVPDQCPQGEFCKVVPDTIEGTCTALPKAGETCVKTVFGDQACAAYLRCEAGTCKALQNLGGACVEDATCYSESCNAGKCVPQGGCT